MAVSRNTALRNAVADAYAARFPAGSLVRIYTGAPPGANNAATGTLLAEITLPASPWAAASTGVAAKQGTWQDSAANATGTAGYARLINAADTERLELDVTATGGGGSLTLDNTSIAVGQVVTISTLTLTIPAT